MPRHSLSCALLTITACAARPAEIEPLRGGYQFKVGDVLRFGVSSILSVDMKGTHPGFFPKGITKPLAWELEGEFENAVLDVDESGDAQIERRVKDLKSSGHFQDEKFGLTWSRERDGAVPEEASLGSLLDRFAANMISVPLIFRVNRQGVSVPEEQMFKRLVMRRGIMYWPVRPGEASWMSTEEIAVPILHHKIRLTFANSITDRNGTVARITAPVSFEEKAEVKGEDGVVFVVGGGATADFSESSGRLRKLELDLRIQFSGKAPLAAGGDGDIKGMVTYKETQVLIE